MTRIAGILLAIGLAVGSQMAWANQITQQQEQRIKELALKAILENPEIIEEAIEKLRQRQAERQQQEIAAIIEERRGELESGNNAPVFGNPNGDVTVVEFFDYNCPYCKRAVGPVNQLLANDKGIRLVFREWPILGPGSVFAARAALAARKQSRYEEFHKALMSTDGRVDENSTLAVAIDLGIDIKKLKQDMSAPEIDEHINKSMDLANSLKMNGTPTFLIGDQLAPGLIPLNQLREMARRARTRP